MIKMELLEKLLRLTLYTGWIKGEKPVSLLIIGKVESGKTEFVGKFRYNKGIVYISDATVHGMLKVITPLLDMNKPLKHIIIPDILNPLSRCQTSARTFIQFFSSLIEEGICKIQTAYIQLEKPVRCGLITTITKDKFMDSRTRWTSIGFVSRLLPVSFQYSNKTVKEILESIYSRDYRNEEVVNINLPENEVEIELSEEMAKKVKPIVDKLLEVEKAYGFRHQKQLQTLLMASALMNGRNKVNEEDVDNILDIGRIINLSYNPL